MCAGRSHLLRTDAIMTKDFQAHLCDAPDQRPKSSGPNAHPPATNHPPTHRVVPVEAAPPDQAGTLLRAQALGVVSQVGVEVACRAGKG
jgi:hypothetical protein